MVSQLLAVMFVAGLSAQQAQPPAAPAAPAADPAALSLFPVEKPPSDAELGGLTVYPTADFLTSYDAGRGQRYYLFGCTASYNELIAYYRTLLKDRGTQVYDQPPTHIFEIGRYDENRMAFPPSITIKDYTWGGLGGFLNPKPGASPERYPTVIQIVPPPATTR